MIVRAYPVIITSYLLVVEWLRYVFRRLITWIRRPGLLFTKLGYNSFGDGFLQAASSYITSLMLSMAGEHAAVDQLYTLGIIWGPGATLTSTTPADLTQIPPVALQDLAYCQI